MTKTNALHPLLVVFAVALSLCGYGGHIKFIQEAHGASATVTPMEGKALIVFVRPLKSLGIEDNMRSSVFEIMDNNPDPQIVGLGGGGTKIAYQVDPGKHLFMVVGETADFMAADVLPNSTYYVWVMARPGNWRARYSLKVVDKQERNSEDFIEQFASSKWVENTAVSLNWATSNMPSIRTRYTRYYPLWTSKPESERSSLLPNDGVGGHSQSSEGGGSGSAVTQMQPAVQTTEEKLRELKRLNDAGLISKEVYLDQQRAILSKP